MWYFNFTSHFHLKFPEASRTSNAFFRLAKLPLRGENLHVFENFAILFHWISTNHNFPKNPSPPPIETPLKVLPSVHDTQILGTKKTAGNLTPQKLTFQGFLGLPTFELIQVATQLDPIVGGHLFFI